MPGQKRGHRKSKRGQKVSAPQQETAIREQLAGAGLPLEDEPWARWVVVGGSPRLISILIQRHKRRKRGEAVPPLPWWPMLITVGILVSAVAAVLIFVWLAAIK